LAASQPAASYLGKLGAEQVLLIVEPLDSGRVNWFRVLDGLPWLLDQ
jgi:hypothetical protein